MQLSPIFLVSWWNRPEILEVWLDLVLAVGVDNPTAFSEWLGTVAGWPKEVWSLLFWPVVFYLIQESGYQAPWGWQISVWWTNPDWMHLYSLSLGPVSNCKTSVLDVLGRRQISLSCMDHLNLNLVKDGWVQNPIAAILRRSWFLVCHQIFLVI